MRRVLKLIVLITIHQSLLARPGGKGVIQGRVFNSKNNEPVAFANIAIFGTTIGSTSDLDGRFLFTGIKPGYVELRVSSIGFEPYISPQILVTNADKVSIDISLVETTIKLDSVVIKASAFRKTEESPLSLRIIGIEEIEKNPGGNRDISKVLQSFPGVASSVSYRNDVIVRGGGPSENKFYLDDIEIPTINHFSTQGASGGPVGIINVDLIREVNFYSGAFPSDRGDALSSIIEFRQVDGNSDKLKIKGTLGASDMGLTLDGPIDDKTTFIISARRSYLQFLFSLLGLPFLPTYNDFQFKIRHRFSDKNELILTGIGALDQSVLNTNADKTQQQRYILGYLPVNDQWNYTIGAVFKHYRENSYDTWVLSRSFLNNVAYKYLNNIEVDSLKVLDYSSYEADNKFRFENTARPFNGLKTNFGLSLDLGQYYNSTYRKSFFNGLPYIDSYISNFNILKFGAFGQVSKDYFSKRLSLSLGARMDGNNYSSEMMNPLKQISPRFSASCMILPNLFLNFNTGSYYELPSYTTLGFRDSTGKLKNKINNVQYLHANHFVAGFEYKPKEDQVITLEGFYKKYTQYPVSVHDSVAIASKGGDFGTFGDEAVVSTGKGHAYGIEFLYRNKDLLGFNMVLSYTYVRSEFSGYTNKLVPSAWDNRNLFNITASRKFRKNWYLGFKWRYVGGAPYTPYNLNTSELQSAWDTQGQGYLDYSKFNSIRLKPFHQLDIRIDKEYYFNKWSLIAYVDVQNVYNFKADSPPLLVRQEDAKGVPLPATGIPPRYPLQLIPGAGGGTVLPTVGIIVQF
jgi:CarboxypepD_reg-like domain/TonB-dependent Receptor Plug Domain